MRKIDVKVDEGLYEAILRFGLARGDTSLSETVRFLLSDSLAHNTEGPYVGLVAQAVREEMETFLAALDERMAFQAEDIAGELAMDAADRAAAGLQASLAALYAASLAAAGEEGDAEAIVHEALDAAAASGLGASRP